MIDPEEAKNALADLFRGSLRRAAKLLVLKRVQHHWQPRRVVTALASELRQELSDMIFRALLITQK